MRRSRENNELMMQGTLIRGMGGLYTVRGEDKAEYVLRAKKKFRRQHMSPLVGDEILFTPGEISDEHGWVEEILPRRSECLRPPVANMTLMCIVMAVQPLPDWLLVDKMLYYARKQGLKTAILINKCDLDGGETARQAMETYRGAQTQVVGISARVQDGLDAVKSLLKGETACFLGQSGVGKSTLLNALFQLNLVTGDISQKIARGKNTTRHAELFCLEDMRVFDTPGFSLLDIEDVFDPVLLQENYPEFEPYLGQCRFSPCYHASEPDCAVHQAVKDGQINKERYERYLILLDVLRKNWRERYD